MSAKASSTAGLTRPVTPQQRLPHIDIIRGIAVFGLIWVNLNAGFYTGPLTPADRVARWTLNAFAAGKFFTLFSLLFGVTLAMQVDRADKASRPVVLWWLRRMVVLYAIGWAHAILFWPGDILREYAIAGAVLIVFRRLSTRALVLTAAVALSVAASRQSLSVLATRLVRANIEAVQQRERPNADQIARRTTFGTAMRTGSYLDVVTARIALMSTEQIRRASPPAGPLNWISPWYLGLFLLGLVLGRHGVVQHPARHHDAVLGLFVCAAGIGLPLSIYLAARPPWLVTHWVYWPLSIAASLSLGLAYLTGLLLATLRAEWLRRLRWLGPVGRLGLTNYIAQTAFISFATSNYGLGLVLGWFDCFVIAAVFYAVQVAWSNWWVRRFSFGPVEWLWRRLTYGARPTRRPALAKAA